jgi:hypothetical protein
VKRVLVLVLLLVAATAAVYALRPAAREPRAAAERPRAGGPTAAIDDASREQLEQVLRQAAREEARPDAKRSATSR